MVIMLPSILRARLKVLRIMSSAWSHGTFISFSVTEPLTLGCSTTLRPAMSPMNLKMGTIFAF